MQNKAIRDIYQESSKRLLLLDYDGTLADIAPTPPEAAPTAEILQLLEKLTADPCNTVVIVSGRKRDELEEWMGDLPLSFAAEHGFWRKIPEQAWQTALTTDLSWQAAPLALVEAVAPKVAGSFVEKKSSGIVWHYRIAPDQVLAEKQATQLAAALRAIDSTPAFTVSHINKHVEIQLLGADKGAAVEYWLAQPGWDFILAAGDEATDEDMLRVMPPEAVTLHIGESESVARERLASAAAMRQFLTELTR